MLANVDDVQIWTSSVCRSSRKISYSGGEVAYVRYMNMGSKKKLSRVLC